MSHPRLSPFPILTTERLILRPLLESDGPEIFGLRSDSDINQYLDRKRSQSLTEALEFIRNVSTHGMLYWAITRKSEHRLMGTVCLFNLSVESHTCEIGYELLRNHQGQGIMAEAVKEVMAFASDVLGVTAIEAFTHQDNQRSIQLLEKLNFEKLKRTDDAPAEVLHFRRSKGGVR